MRSDELDVSRQSSDAMRQHRTSDRPLGSSSFAEALQKKSQEIRSKGADRYGEKSALDQKLAGDDAKTALNRDIRQGLGKAEQRSQAAFNQIDARRHEANVEQFLAG